MYEIYIDYGLLDKYQIPEDYLREFLSPVSSVTKEDIFRFVNNNECIYIYGAGVRGKRMFYMLRGRKQLKGFIISDDQVMEQADYRGIPVYRLSEINMEKEQIGIIVAMAEMNARQIRSLLENRTNVLYT